MHCTEVHISAGSREVAHRQFVHKFQVLPLTVTPGFTQADECYFHLFKLNLSACNRITLWWVYLSLQKQISPNSVVYWALCMSYLLSRLSLCDWFHIFCHTSSFLQCIKVWPKGTNMTLFCPLLRTRETHLSHGRMQPVDYKQTPHGWSCKPITHPLLTRPRIPA